MAVLLAESNDISLPRLPIHSSVSGVGLSPAPHGAHVSKTSQVLLAGVHGDFSRGSPVFAPPTDWPVSYELK